MTRHDPLPNVDSRSQRTQADPAIAVPKRAVPERVVPERVVPERVVPERVVPDVLVRGPSGGRWLLLGILTCGWLAVAAAEATASSKDVPTADAAAIDHWVSQLGSTLYVQRQRAKQEIQRIGVAAFESLHKAQFDSDVEIRKQAEYLLRSIPIAWTEPDDTPALRMLLSNYNSLSADQRLLRIERLRQLDNGDATTAYCRVTRFETSELLSKHAALSLIQQQPPAEPTQFEQQVKTILGPSQRAAALWLTTYCQGLRDPLATLPTWRELGQREVQLVLDHRDANRQSLLRDFLRWRIAQLNGASDGKNKTAYDDELAWVLREQWMPVQVETADALLVETEWMLENQVWSAVDLLATAYPKLFDETPQLRYRLAEVMLRRGKQEVADQLAARVSESIGTERPDERLELAYDLQTRGLVEWAAREYESLLAQEPPESYFAVVGANFYGLMCHDYGWNLKAYEAYSRLVKLMNTDEQSKQLIQRYRITPREVQSKMHFSHALHLGDQGKHDEQRNELRKALSFDERGQPNADIVIAMYRVPDSDKPWRDATLDSINDMRERFETGIEAAEIEFKSNPTPDSQRVLAMQLNQFAWLVSNTTGDYQAALRASQRSLKIVGENGGYLDTLARCHFAVGDLEKAIATQRRAIELDHAPGGMYSGQIKMQYDFFLRQTSDGADGKRPAVDSAPANEPPAKDPPVEQAQP